jgi:hypothetical protein
MELTPEQIVAIQAENETLKRTLAEITEKSRTRKVRITEHEATITDLQGKLTERDAAIQEIAVNAPLKAMAKVISNDVPIFLEQFRKSYSLQMIGDKLTLLSASDGKPILDKQGNPIPFEREPLLKMLGDPTHQNAAFYSRLLVVSRASGGGASNVTQKRVSTEPKQPKIQFGLQ